jgi:hypothetical protein
MQARYPDHSTPFAKIPQTSLRNQHLKNHLMAKVPKNVKGVLPHTEIKSLVQQQEINPTLRKLVGALTAPLYPLTQDI